MVAAGCPKLNRCATSRPAPPASTIQRRVITGSPRPHAAARLRDGDDTPDLALLLTESAGWRCQRERARSKRNENFSAIIHYAPLGGHYARLRQAQQASEFLMTGSAVDPVID